MATPGETPPEDSGSFPVAATAGEAQPIPLEGAAERETDVYREIRRERLNIMDDDGDDDEQYYSIAEGEATEQEDDLLMARRLTEEEFERFKKEGRCFICRAKGHVASACPSKKKKISERYGHRRACVAAGGRRTRDEGVIWKGDPGDFYMKVIAKKFRGVWHYGVITGVVTEWVLEDYGGATQWRAVFEDGSGKVTVQSGWVMEDCLHHMETFSILNAGPLLEEARNVVTEEDGPERKAQVDALTREGRTRYPARRQGAAAGAARRQGAAAGQRGAKARRPGQRGAKARRPGQRGAKARRPGQRGAKARRPGQRGAKARRPGQRGAKARRPGQRGAKARRPGQRGAKARRPGQRGAKARRPGQRGAKARRPGQRGAKARRPGQRGAKTAHTAESAERDALQAVDGSR
eukprot:jgi/Tetstr1/440249/TSEL_028600.t1